jgi:gliding motility-associated-like protein
MEYITLYVVYKEFNMDELLKNIQRSFFLKLFFSFTLILLSFFSFSQLSISKKYTPSGIVNQVLKGKGVEISNVVFRGASNAIGTFTAENTNLGIKEGIILSTGSIYNAIGPNKGEDKSTDFTKTGFALLGSTTYDAAILEFDFTPQGDSIEFQYVFASEEYPEYVNKEFNDIFGFFISGPGISGVQNIALLPDGNTVTINNVNQFKNSNYYISNSGGATIEYDGFTSVLTARAVVQCGKTYHLILAVADVQDYVYDSAIFLSAKSLSVPSEFEVKHKLSNYYFDDDSTKMAENCTSATLQINRSPQFVNRKSVLEISMEGSAIENKDFSNTIPKSISFEPGELTKEIKFDVLFDKEVDEIDSMIFVFSNIEICQPFKYKLLIENINPFEVVFDDDTVHCEDKPIFIKPTVKGGIGPFSYVWSSGSFIDSIQVKPSATTPFTVTVKDQCFKNPITVSNKVVVPVYLPLEVNTIPDIQEVCPLRPNNIPLKPINGGGGYKYTWYRNTVLYSQDRLDVIKEAKTSFYKVIITDRCNDTVSTRFKFIILSPPIKTKMFGDSIICYKDSSLIGVNATGGYGEYSYRWENLVSKSQTAISKKLTSSWFFVNVSDACQTFEVRDSFFVRVMRPFVDFQIEGDPIVNTPISLINKSKNVTSYAWYIDRNLVSKEYNAIISVPDSANHAFRLYVTDDFGCTGDTTIYLLVYYQPSVYVPNAFTPVNNFSNKIFQPILTSIKEVEFSIYNRWGQLLYQTKDLNKCYWDGRYNGELCPNDLYVYKLKTISVTNVKKEHVGHVSLIK